MNQTKLAKILEDHEAWLRGNETGRRANLSYDKFSGADLINANLSHADLSGANLINVNLSGANLINVNLSGADLINVNLSGANLINVNLSGADLSGADLRYANLSDANLSGADLRYANLSGANLSGCRMLHLDVTRQYILYVIPEAKEMTFIAGCRTFTLDQALTHWGANSPRSQPEYIAAINAYMSAQKE